MPYDLEDVGGIGKATADRMRSSGIKTVEQLASLKSKDLIDLNIKGVGESTAVKYIKNANILLSETQKMETETPLKETKKEITPKLKTEESVLEGKDAIKKQAEYLMKKFTQARNNDFYLTWLWLKIFPKIDLPWLEWEKICQLSGKLQTVSRIRRIIQNEEKRLLATDLKIRAKRQRRSQLMKKAIKRA